MSSHQDYLQRRRVAHLLQDPAASLPSVLSAHAYAEIKAFVLETKHPRIGSSLARQAQHTPLALDDPAKFDLRGLPTALPADCPPAYPMCGGTDDLTARANRTPPRGYPHAPGACAAKTPVDGFTAVQRCLLLPAACGGMERVQTAARPPPCFTCGA